MNERMNLLPYVMMVFICWNHLTTTATSSNAKMFYQTQVSSDILDKASGISEHLTRKSARLCTMEAASRPWCHLTCYKDNQCSLYGIEIQPYLSNIANAVNHCKTDIRPPKVGSTISSCQEIQEQGITTSGAHTIFPYDCCPNHPVRVYCDMETEGGPWTVIQRRDDIQPREDFNRKWIEYAQGFGDVSGEFWLGLDHIHTLTARTPHLVRFELEDFEGKRRWAEYNHFYIHSQNLSYKLEVTGYSGDAGDAMKIHNGQRFSAKDKDLDGHSSNHCSAKYGGGWWFNACHKAFINGQYFLDGIAPDHALGITWSSWHGFGYSLKKTVMKIKPVY